MYWRKNYSCIAPVFPYTIPLLMPRQRGVFFYVESLCMKEIGIGLLGFGTVGAGVVEGLQRNASLIEQRTGLRLVIRNIADLDVTSDRGVAVDASLLTTDAVAVVDNPSVDLVVELIGGVTIARDLALRALKAGKPVVTANKALLAEHGAELYRAADDHNADLLFEASVAGGIPIIRALREGLLANHIDRMYGILNGTCNYILTRMESDRLPFDQILKEAQAEGYAEAEPGLDIDGWDTAHKAVVLASQAYGRPVAMSDVLVEGIRDMDPVDIEHASRLGYRIKLLAVIKLDGGEIEVRVHPALVPLPHMLASVGGVFNAVVVRGDIVGETLYYGRGAGRLPTASAVIGDIAEAARNLAVGAPQRVPAFVAHDQYSHLRPSEEVRTRYYLRLSLKDEPGLLGQVAGILGDNGISIASVMQAEARAGEYVPVIILTHEAAEKHFQAALARVDALPEVNAPVVRIRIEDFK
jgi:homoserine dehydrogenase